MSEPAPRIFPRSSAFEALLARVYLELWDIQDDPAMFARRVEKFARVFLPAMFKVKLKEKLPDFDARLDEMHRNINLLKNAQRKTDPYTASVIDSGSIPAEEADFAEEIWHEIVNVLTDAGFNFPMARQVERRRMQK